LSFPFGNSQSSIEAEFKNHCSFGSLTTTGKKRNKNRKGMRKREKREIKRRLRITCFQILLVQQIQSHFFNQGKDSICLLCFHSHIPLNKKKENSANFSAKNQNLGASGFETKQKVK
jgi:hypothetical protein